jgi:hypothetical protein
MTRSMYRSLLWLHPAPFRREFAGEMLWIFDESAQAGSIAPLFADGMVSLLRQWFLRSGYWKVFAALAGALFQVTIGGALMFRIGQSSTVAAVPAENVELIGIMRLAALTAAGLFAAVIFLVFWWRNLARRTGT